MIIRKFKVKFKLIIANKVLSKLIIKKFKMIIKKFKIMIFKKLIFKKFKIKKLKMIII